MLSEYSFQTYPPNTNKAYFLKIMMEDMYSKKTSIYYTNRLQVHLNKWFVGYEQVDFQFLKHDGYAQRLCISNLQFWFLKKKHRKVKLNNLTSSNKTNMNKIQNKITYGEMNPNSMMNSTRLQHKFPTPTTPHTKSPNRIYNTKPSNFIIYM